MNTSQVIVKPLLTEKTVSRTDAGKYTFLIHEDATKVDVKIALRALYGVTVAQVNVLKGMPKFRLGKNRKPLQKRETARRAIVTLKAGETLDLSKLKSSTDKK